MIINIHTYFLHFKALGDIKVALKLIGQGDDTDAEAEVDKRYKSLGIDLEPVDPSEDDYKVVQKYIENTHGKTHAQYSLEIESLFRLNKKVGVCVLCVFVYLFVCLFVCLFYFIFTRGFVINNITFSLF